MAFNWPNVPDTKTDKSRNELYTAILMLYVKCFNDCMDTVDKERKLISLAGTKRGSHLLTWVSDEPPPPRKQFIVPPARKKTNIQDFVTMKFNKQQTKLLDEFNATIKKANEEDVMGDFYAQLNEAMNLDGNVSNSDGKSLKSNISSGNNSNK